MNSFFHHNKNVVMKKKKKTSYCCRFFGFFFFIDSWFCDNLFFYFTERFYAIPQKYCKTKALLSPQENPPWLYSHMWWHRVLSVYTMPAFTVWYSSNNDSGLTKKKKERKIVRDQTHFWCGAYESFSIDIAFRLIRPFSLHSVTSSSHLAGFADNCVNWKVWASFVWMFCAFQLCVLAHWAHFSRQSRSKVLMYKKHVSGFIKGWCKTS